MGKRWGRMLAIAAVRLAGQTAGWAADVEQAPAPPVPVRVILPDGYAEGEGRYPVLYLFNTVWDSCADTPACEPFLARLREQPFITVYEAESHFVGDYVDWHDGSHAYERDRIALLDWVDSQYRTVPERSHRAVAGTSAGGYGAALVAAHRPDLFGSLASFSGVVDLLARGPASQAVFDTMGRDPFASEPFAVWGKPVVDDANWRANNPADLADRLTGTEVFHSTAPGVPCGPEDVNDRNVPGLELVVRDGNDSFDAALTAAGVAHRYLVLPCGVHQSEYFVQQFDAWLDDFSFPID